MENLNLFIRSVFIDNMIFAYFLGMCSYLAVSKNVKTAFGLGIAVTFMLVITLPIAICISGNLSSSDCRKLRNLGLFVVYATKRLRICRHCHNLRLRIGHRMAVGNRLPRRHTRASVILQRPRPSKRHRHHIYNYWAYGHSVYEFSRN